MPIGFAGRACSAFRPSLAVAGVGLVMLMAAPSRAEAALSVRLTVVDQAGGPLAGLPVKALPLPGGIPVRRITDAAGRAVFRLSAGLYRFQARCLGYPFTSAPVKIPERRRVALTIPQRMVTVTVREVFAGLDTPMPGLPVILRRASGGNVVAGPVLTGDGGTTCISLPKRAFRFEVGYLGGTYTSADFVWENQTVNIPVGRLDLSLTHGGQPLPEAAVTVLGAAGEATGIGGTSDAGGLAAILFPPGTYRAAVVHDETIHLGPSFAITRDLVTFLGFDLISGHEPGLSFRAVPRQVPDGRNLVEISLAASDADGDGCRLRLEYSPDGFAWSRATLAAEVRVGYAGPGGVPSVDNAAAFPLGQGAPVATDRGANTVTFFWDAARDLPDRDSLEVSLRAVIHDGSNQRTTSLPPPSWMGLGHLLAGPGLSDTPQDSYQPSLAVDTLGRPHVAWIESSPSGDAVAYLHWDGHAWVDTGGAGREGMIIRRTGSSMHGLSLALDGNDRPRIAWDAASGDRRSIYYLAWDGAAWRGTSGRAGDEGPILDWPGDLEVPHLAVDRQGRSHLVFSAGYGEAGGIFYLAQAGDRWVDAGGRGQGRPRIATTASIYGTSLALDGRGRPHVAWCQQDEDGWFSLHHRLLDGWEWRSLDPAGDDLTHRPFAANPALAVGADGRSHLVWMEMPGADWSLSYASWGASAPGPPEVAAPPNAGFPAIALLPDGTPLVAFLDWSSGVWVPTLVKRDSEGWVPWAGLTAAVAPAPRQSLGISLAVGAEGTPLVAFDDYDTATDEIYLVAPSAGSLGLDTAAPTVPGPPIPGTPVEAGRVPLTFGAPARDAHFAGYVIEASTDPGFPPPVTRFDQSRDPALGSADYGGREGTVVDGLEEGRLLHFRTVAVDRVGHRSVSSPAGPVSVPVDAVPPRLTLLAPAEGAVTPDREILVTVATDDPSARIFANGHELAAVYGATWEGMVPLDEGDNALLLRGVDEAGNVGELRAAVVSIPLQLTSPPEGAAISGGSFEVTGTCGAPCSLVDMDLLATHPAGGRFSFFPVPASAGEILLHVRACDALGRCSERRRTVRGMAEEAFLTLRAEPPVGAAPLDTRLICDLGEVSPASRFSWDLNHDGTPEREGESLPAITWRFDAPGLYHPEVTVTDPGGVRYRARALVTVHPSARVLAVLPAASPEGVAVDPDGYLYVSETGAHRISVYDPFLNPLRVITEAPPGTPLVHPTGLTVDDDGLLWAADPVAGRIVILDREGTCVDDLSMNIPYDRLARQGRLFYAVETGGQRLQRFERHQEDDEVHYTGFGLADVSTESLGGVRQAAGIALDEQGRLFLADAAGGRLLLYQDRFVHTFQILEYQRALITGLQQPVAVSRSRESRELAVLEQGSATIRLFDPDGAPRGVIGPAIFGDTPPASPRDLAIRRTREGLYVYLADTGNNRVLVILIPGDDPLQPITDLRNGLLAGDLAAITATFHPFNREKHLAFVREISGHFAEAAAWFERVEFVSLEGDLARARVIKETTIGEVSDDFEFEIILLKDDEGQWKLLDF